MVMDIVVERGPRVIIVGGKVLATVDNISIQVAEATEEELEKLKSAYEIRLVKMLGEGDSVVTQLRNCAVEYKRLDEKGGL